MRYPPGAHVKAAERRRLRYPLDAYRDGFGVSLRLLLGISVACVCADGLAGPTSHVGGHAPHGRICEARLFAMLVDPEASVPDGWYLAWCLVCRAPFPCRAMGFWSGGRVSIYVTWQEVD